MTEHDEDYVRRIIEAFAVAEVMSVFFVRVGRSLILDFRTADGVPPAVLLDGMVSSPHERLRSFERIRPELPLPERLTLVPWTAAVRHFDEEGLLGAMLARCEREGGEELRGSGESGFRSLRRLEQRYLRDLIRGVGMRTIWQRPEK